MEIPAPLYFRSVCLIAFIAGALTLSLSHAADSTWNLNNAGSWGIGSNWTSGSPGSTSLTTNTDTATFGTVITTGRTVTVDTGRNLQGIDFAGNSFAYALTGGSLLMTSGGTIQTSGGGSAHTDSIASPIQIQSDSGTFTFAANSSTVGRQITLAGGITGISSTGNQTVLNLTGSNTGNNEITGIIGNGSSGGSLAIVKDGSGTWRLGGANTYSGGTTIRGGTLTATAAGAFGSGAITLGNSSGGNTDASLFVRASSLTFSNPIVLASNTTGALRIGTTGAATVSPNFSGDITGTNNLVFHNGADNGTLTYSGAINHSGTLTHTGSGGAGSTSITSSIGSGVTSITQDSSTTSLGLSANNSTFTGAIYIKVGTLTTSTTSSSLGGTGTVVYLGDTTGSANATLRLNSNLTYSRPITVRAGSSGILRLDFGGNTSHSGGITLNNDLVIRNPGNGVSAVTGGITGTGNVAITNDTPAVGSPISLTGTAVNHSGTLTNNGSGIATTTISAPIGANVTNIIQNSATSSLFLSGANPAFGGSVDVVAGTVSIGNSGALTSVNPVNVKSGGTFNLNNRDLSIAGLNDQSGSGGIVTNSGATGRTLTLAGGGTYSFSGNLTAATPANLSVTKSGNGIQTFEGTNSYTGATAVNAGQLVVNGSLASSSVSVGASGTLGGSGTLSGSVSVSGELAPGNSPGILTVNNSVTLNSGSTFSTELNGTSVGSSYDQLAVGASGILSLTGSNNLELTLGYTPSVGDQFTIALVQGSSSSSTAGIFETLNGAITDLSQGAVFTLAGYDFAISYQAEGSVFNAGGNDIMLQLLAVPEPSSGTLFIVAFATGALAKRTRRHAKRTIE